MDEIEARFWAKVRKTETCWLWTASLRNKGYGAFTYMANGQLVQDRAHRYSYEVHKGPIPKGMFCLHRCDTPSCVNPDHLFIGTNTDNVRDMMSKGRRVPPGTYGPCEYARGEAHHAAKLTPALVRKIRLRHAKGSISYAVLGQMFGINQSTAYKIVKRLAWTHI